MTQSRIHGSLHLSPASLDMMETELLSGRCACGQTVFEVRAATASAVCYCDTCRRVSGGLGMAWVDGKRSSLSMHGPVSRWRSSTHAYRHFCAVCGTHLLLIEDAGGDSVEIAVGALEQQSALSVDHERYVASRPTWVETRATAQRDSS
jgi:hypothetical protein